MSSKKLDPIEKGLYEFKIPEPGDVPLKILVRFQSQYAYVGIGKDSTAALGAKALVDPAKLLDPSDKSLVSLKLHFDRLPKEIREEMANGLKDLKGLTFAEVGQGTAAFVTMSEALRRGDVDYLFGAVSIGSAVWRWQYRISRRV